MIIKSGKFIFLFLSELKLDSNAYTNNKNNNNSPKNIEDFSNKSNLKSLPSNNQIFGPSNNLTSSTKNLNVFLPNIDNSYFANHIQEVLNPILDDTGNYSFYNINNEIDFTNDPEHSSDFDSRRLNNQNEKYFENQINNNYDYMNNYANSDMFSNKKRINPNAMMMGFNEADKRKFHNYNNTLKISNNKNSINTEIDNSEFLDFKNLNNPANNFAHNNPMINFNKNRLNNDEYMNNFTPENLWGENNFGYQGESPNNMMYQNDHLINNNMNNRGRQFYQMNNYSANNPYEAINPKAGKANQKNSMGFNSNIPNHEFANNNFNSMPMMPRNINNINPNLIMSSKVNKNFQIGNIPQVNINQNNNMKYNPNWRGNQNLLMENTPNINNSNNNKNFKQFGGNSNLNNNNNINFNMQAGSPINNTIDHNTMLNLKLNKNISNYTELSHEELAKNALVISKDQCGCRFIQKKISENSDFSNNYLFPQVNYF